MRFEMPARIPHSVRPNASADLETQKVTNGGEDDPRFLGELGNGTERDAVGRGKLGEVRSGAPGHNLPAHPSSRQHKRASPQTT
jgi:hypothetical protein